MPARAASANEEEVRSIGILRPLAHHIGAYSFQCRRLVEIDYALGSRFAAHAARMIEADPDHHPPSAVGEIDQMKAKHFAGTKTTVEHQANYRQIATAAELRDQRVDVLIRHRAGHAMYLP